MCGVCCLPKQVSVAPKIHKVEFAHQCLHFWPGLVHTASNWKDGNIDGQIQLYDFKSIASLENVTRLAVHHSIRRQTQFYDCS